MKTIKKIDPVWMLMKWYAVVLLLALVFAVASSCSLIQKQRHKEKSNVDSTVTKRVDSVTFTKADSVHKVVKRVKYDSEWQIEFDSLIDTAKTITVINTKDGTITTHRKPKSIAIKSSGKQKDTDSLGVSNTNYTHRGKAEQTTLSKNQTHLNRSMKIGAMPWYGYLIGTLLLLLLLYRLYSKYKNKILNPFKI